MINAERLLNRIDQLAAIGAQPDGGTTREAFSPEDVAARDLVGQWLVDAGATVHVDAAANLIAELPGPSGRWLVTGSHLDTVTNAGPLDGVYGVVAAIEVVELARTAGWQHGLRVVAFSNEEGARGTPGMTGSRAVVDGVPPDELALIDDSGRRIADWVADAGGNPDAIDSARWDLSTIAAFVELHIEQGPVLDTANTPIGIVDAVTGRQAFDITLRGAANHAGTTPMHARNDALVAAAAVIEAVRRLPPNVRVATCSRIDVFPNVRNVVPGTVTISGEFRDESPMRLADAVDLLPVRVASALSGSRVDWTVEWGQLVPPTPADPAVIDVITRVTGALPTRRLPSGAGHDAQVLGTAVPMGMVFVPSIGGVSHHPTESTTPTHLTLGARVLAEVFEELDRTLSAS